jgi:hypothetical protein
VTSPGQLFHFEKIQKHISDATIFIAVDEGNSRVPKQVVQMHAPSASIAWVTNRELRKIDGRCDVLVCQAPGPLTRRFSRSLTVAQQYSLSDERRQYGAWRANASLNLMYGGYSCSRVSDFCNAVAAGNPLLDDSFADGRIPVLPGSPQGTLRVLYIAADERLASDDEAIRKLRTQDIILTIKPGDRSVAARHLATSNDVRVASAHVHPIGLILEHDVVVTGNLAAAFDALAVRKPVVLMNTLDMYRGDPPESAIRSLAGVWTNGCSLREAFEYSLSTLGDDVRFREFIQEYFVNTGSAGLACAHEIRNLAERGEECRFVVRQIRDAIQDCKLQNSKPRSNALIAGRRRATRLLAYFRTLGQVRRTNDHKDDTAPGAGSLPVVPRERRRAVLSLIEPLLKARSVGYRTHVAGSRAYCAVPESDLDELCNALNALGRQVGPARVQIRFGCETRYDDVCFAESLLLADVAQADSMIVDIPHQERQRLARSGGVEILIVEQRSGRFVARRRRAEKVDWTTDFSAGANEVRSDDREAGTGYAKLHALEGEPVDVVYTWVDSTDPQWAAARRDWANRQTATLDSSDNDQRYLNRDELRYSLRSLWLYAPFVRNVFVVTAGHHPQWLDVTHKNVQLIPHSLIFPRAEDLPTFNSHAIEACLHRIPGLAEHFLYFNDDVFLGRETTVNTFYTKGGLIKSRLSPTASVPAVQPGSAATPTDWAAYNAASLICRDFALQFDRKVKHVPMPMKRSLLIEIEERYGDFVRATRAARFRSPTDLAIPSMLAHFYGISSGQAVEWDHVAGEYIYADTGQSGLETKLSAIKSDSPQFFCLNATRHAEIAPARQSVLLRKFFEEMYPLPSPYEHKATL